MLALIAMTHPSVSIKSIHYFRYFNFLVFVRPIDDAIFVVPFRTYFKTAGVDIDSRQFTPVIYHASR